MVRLPAFHGWGQIVPDVRCHLCGYSFPTEFVPTPHPEETDD